jgi:hypothetical protein
MVEKKRLGISTILITVLLIVIALVFVGLLYTFGRGLFGGLSTTASLEITKYDIVVGSDGSALVLVEVKNTGNVKIQNLDPPVITGVADAFAGKEWVMPQGGLDAGKTAYISTTLPAGSVETGKSYPILITGSATNGMKVSASSSTVAHPKVK